MTSESHYDDIVRGLAAGFGGGADARRSPPPEMIRRFIAVTDPATLRGILAEVLAKLHRRGTGPDG